MTEQIDTNLYRIGVPLPGNPLRETNAYFLRGKDRDLLIDTGFRRRECREALEEGLKELGSAPERRSVLATHLHSDHSGMADLFCGPAKQEKDGSLRPDSPRIYLGGMERGFMGQVYDMEVRTRRRGRFLREGFPKEILDDVYAVNPAINQALPKGFKDQDPRIAWLQDGEEIPLEDLTLKTVYASGHTPGNCMFWMESRQIMFTGDHILFDITPNITDWDGVRDSLGDYLDHLEAVRKYPVRLALPGHRKPGDYHQRIDELLSHHDRRLRETEQIIRDEPGLCGYDIAGRMRWKIRAKNWEEFPPTQKWFAVGECFSHLDYLLLRGRIAREEAGPEEDDRNRYYDKRQNDGSDARDTNAGSKIS